MGSHRYTGPRHARPRGPRHARPMPPSAAHRVAAAGTVAAALVAGETLSVLGAGAASAVTPDTWAKLRICESSGNYAANTGNGYYGAYQFNLATWKGLGYSGLPSAAAPATQDQAAQRLYAARGWEPWPACSAKLGLVDDRAASRGDTRPPLPPAPKPAPAPAPKPAPAAPVATAVPVSVSGPAWDGHYISVRDVGQVRSDVKALQAKLVADGYPLSVDGRYGPQTAGAATQFEISHGLHVERPAIVGPQVWTTVFGQH